MQNFTPNYKEVKEVISKPRLNNNLWEIEVTYGDSTETSFSTTKLQFNTEEQANKVGPHYIFAL